MENQPVNEKPESASTTERVAVATWLEANIDAKEHRSRHERLMIRPPERSVRTGIRRLISQVNRDLLLTFAKLAAGDLPWPLYIHGGVGSGKTYASLCFCDVVQGAGYFTCDEIADAIMNGGSPEFDLRPLVVLDEVGERTKIGDLARQAVKRTLDERERHNNHVAIYVSNFRPEDLVDSHDGPIVSRLRAGTVFHLDAKDRRQER